MALNAASCAVRSGAVGAPSTLTVIDYSKPSSERRLWVFDLKAKELVYEELVAHGQGSGALRKGLHEFLRTHPVVASYRFATAEEGGGGVTVVQFK